MMRQWILHTRRAGDWTGLLLAGASLARFGTPGIKRWMSAGETAPKSVQAALEGWGIERVARDAEGRHGALRALEEAGDASAVVLSSGACLVRGAGPSEMPDGALGVAPLGGLPAEIREWGSNGWGAESAVGVQGFCSATRERMGLPLMTLEALLVGAGDGSGWAAEWRKAWEDRADRNEGASVRAAVSFARCLCASGRPWRVVGRQLVFPARWRPMERGVDPWIAVYEEVGTLRRDEVLRQWVRRLAEDVPEWGRWLAQEAEAGWRELAGPRAIPAGATAARRDLVITGIPRSGTSYLCNVLHRYENCVVINEPAEVFEPLRTQPQPWGVATFMQEVRARIVDGLPVMNKLHNGKVVEDTTVMNEASAYCPRPVDDQFALGVKNPLAFVGRLGELRRVLPEARLAVCVRNPFDTVASWKASFANLREARAKNRAQDRLLPNRLREAAAHVSAIADDGERRAAWWRVLAEMILDHRADIMLIRYPDLIERPHETLEALLEGYRAGALREAMEPSTVRSRQDDLSDTERRAIWRQCGDAASELGVI